MNRLTVDYSDHYGCWVVWERFPNHMARFGTERRVYAFAGSQRLAEALLREAGAL